jgi:type IV secretion system protein VirB10
MSHEEGSAPDRVEGERDVSIVHRVRSLQSRLSSLLAGALMTLLGVGVLTWYYTSTFARQARARAAVRAHTLSNAAGDLPPPPLGQIDAPAAAMGAPVSDRPGTLAARALPDDLAAYSASGPDAAYGPPGSQAKTPAELAEERKLSGAVFARDAQAGSAPGRSGASSSGAVGAAAPQGLADSARGAGEWGALLRPTATPAVQAQLLPTQRFLLPKGAFIDCTLQTAIDSTLPGLTSCIAATDTFGVDGKVVLLERGTELVGETRGQVQQGTARVFVLWTQARTPTGVMVPLDSPAADELGRAGLPGDVDRHFWDRFGAAMLVSVIDGSVQAAVQSTSRGGGTIIYDPTDSQGILTEALKGTINISPTLVKHNGDRIQVLVARDLDFRPVYELRTSR